jgi:DNA-binding transcriptional regulator YdaS (Cro superfamily)
MTKLGDYLRKKGMTQMEFARLSGLHGPMVCLWSHGKRRPGLASALAIEKATHGEVPASYWAKFNPHRKAG